MTRTRRPHRPTRLVDPDSYREPKWVEFDPDQTPPRLWLVTEDTQYFINRWKPEFPDLRFVYFIRAYDEKVKKLVSGPVKIGVANDPYERIAALQIGSPVRLVLVAVAIGSREFE